MTAGFAADARLPVERSSFTQLERLISIEDLLKSAFYEIECIRSNWSVRAMRRQIATLYFERPGPSKDKEKLAAMVKKGVQKAEPELAIRDPYIFEFLGLRAEDAMAETDLETALVENPIPRSTLRTTFSGDVSAALHLPGDSLEAEVQHINTEGSQAMQVGDYDTAQAVIDFAKRRPAAGTRDSAISWYHGAVWFKGLIGYLKT